MPAMPQHTLPIGEPHLINEIYNPHIDLPLLRENLKRAVEDRPGKLPRDSGIRDGTTWGRLSNRIMNGRTHTVLLVCLWYMAIASCTFSPGPISDGPSDGTISKDVEAKLTADQFGEFSGILVATEAGVVTLVGTVERAEQKARAADLTRQVKGVKRVKNDLIIQPTRPSQPPP